MHLCRFDKEGKNNVKGAIKKNWSPVKFIPKKKIGGSILPE